MTWLRSYLFAPGNSEKLVAKVFGAGADAIVLDLEDAVPPSEKVRARQLVAKALSRTAPAGGRGADGRPSVFVRINALDSQEWREDINASVTPAVAAIRVPKAESLDMFCRLNDAISQREELAGLRVGSLAVVATIESARGLARVDEIGGAPRLSGFTFGSSDYCADVGADPIDETATLFARSRLVMASRCHRLNPPVASVFTRLDDDAGLRADTMKQRALGFFGRSAVHPRQLATIHQLFSPTDDEVKASRDIVAAFETSRSQGVGALQTGGGFVDAAVVRRAEATIELSERQRREGR